MLKKISILAVFGVCLSFNAWAVPNDAEFTKCLKNNSTDAGLTKCYRQETEATQKEIQRLEEMLRPKMQTFRH